MRPLISIGKNVWGAVFVLTSALKMRYPLKGMKEKEFHWTPECCKERFLDTTFLYKTFL